MNDVFHVMGQMMNGELVIGTTEIQVPPDWFFIGQNKWSHEVALLWGTAPANMPDWGKHLTNHLKQKLTDDWDLGRCARVASIALRNQKVVARPKSEQINFQAGNIIWGVRRAPGQPIIPMNDLARKFQPTPQLLAAAEFVAKYLERTNPPQWRGRDA